MASSHEEWTLEQEEEYDRNCDLYIQSRITLPCDLKAKQREIYDKNCELFKVAYRKRPRGLLEFLGDFGIQDYWDVKRFYNFYPFHPVWYQFAYGPDACDTVKVIKYTPEEDDEADTNDINSKESLPTNAK